MPTKMMSLRLADDLRDWVQAYADQRGVSRSAVIEAAVRGLRADAEAGVPDLPEPEAVPAPGEKGTAHWRDPTEEELASARARFPDLPPDRLLRLARAEARQVDMGLPQPKPREEATREDLAVSAKARSEFFAKLRQPESVKKWGK